MTYCVGFCTDQGVFIAADTSFSSMAPPINNTNSSVRTVFGERQGEVGEKPWKFVFENGMKLAVGDGMVAGFAGDVCTARSLVDAYWIMRAKTLSSREALRDALLNVTPSENDADVLFAFYELGKPCLLHVRVATAVIQEVNGLIQLGSELPSGQHESTKKLVSAYTDLLRRFRPHPLHMERVFSQLVSALQSYGVHDYLLPYGVGGAFVAAWVTPEGARWQGDHLYIVHGREPSSEDLMCATMIRRDALCLVNNQIDSNKVIIMRRPLESDADIEARAELAISEALNAWDNAKFDYFVSINKSSHVVTVLEMRLEQHHELLSLHAPGMEDKLGIVWTKDFLNRTNIVEGLIEPNSECLSVRFQPFKEASEELQEERNQFAWQNFVDWQRN